MAWCFVKRGKRGNADKNTGDIETANVMPAHAINRQRYGVP
jgi:hypothetical protein